MCSLALALDPDFNIDRIIFSYNDLIDVARRRDHKPGSVFIFDEITADALQARNFMSKKNKNLSALLQTFRNMRYVVILTTPSLRFLDVQAKQLLHLILITTKQGLSEELAEKYRIVNVFAVDNSVGSQLGWAKQWYKPPTWIIDGYPIEASQFMIPKPPLELVKKYEKKKREFQDRLYDKLQKDYDDGFGKQDFGDVDFTDVRHRSNRFGDQLRNIY